VSTARDEVREAPLIQPVPIDSLINLYSNWTQVDDGFARQIRSIDSEVAAVRGLFKQLNVTPDETPGASPPASVGAAVEAMATARRGIEALRKEHAAAWAALRDAESEAEAALAAVTAVARDLRRARWMVGVIASLLACALVGILASG
jgi:hypothetical protein